MKKNYFYIALVALALTGCADNLPTVDTPEGKPDITIPADAEAGELLIKFSPEMSDILDQAQLSKTRSGKATRSGIPSTDEVLAILGSYSFERVFPVDANTEARTRQAGLHLWYTVKFDKGTDLKAAAERLKQLGEISKVQPTGRIKRAYSTETKRIYLSDKALQQQATRAAAEGEPNDPGFAYQWHYRNLGAGNYGFENLNDNNAGAEAGCDVNALEAWKTCSGDPSIIVAVLDEGVMYTHPDLAPNMWCNPGETTQGAKTDADGNGYEGDLHGYNFVEDSGNISWSDANDTGHGTHVAVTIAAANNNGIKNNTYVTPKSTSILPSITNRSLMQIAEDLGMKVERRPVPEEDLETFEEAGACGTAAVISPISHLDDMDTGKVYNFGEKPGPWSTKLYETLRGIQYGTVEDKHGWTTVVIE